MRTALLLFFLCGCGTTALDDAGEPVDGGVEQADAGTDAGALWCAPEGQACLADGWEYDKPGRCCINRQTCRPEGCAY